MVQILPARPTFLSRFSEEVAPALQKSLERFLGEQKQEKRLGEEDTALGRLGLDTKGIRDPRLRALLVEGKVKEQLAQLPKSSDQITPYQQELIKQRGAQLDLQKQRIEQAKERGRKDLPQMIAKFTSPHAKELGLKPEEKILLDKFVSESYSGTDMDLNDALSQGLDRLAERREAVESIKIPSRPFASDYRGAAKTQAMQQAASTLKEAYDAGIASIKQLRDIAKSGGWKKDEIDQMIRFIEGASKVEAPKDGGKDKKIPFDSKNPEHVARAREILAEVGGDKGRANAILAEEFIR